MVSHAGASETGGSEGKLHKLVPPDLVRSKITVLQICMHRGLVVQTMYQIHILQGLLDFLIPLNRDAAGISNPGGLAVMWWA